MLERIQCRLPQRLGSIPVRPGEEETDRLPRMMVSACLLDSLQIATAVHGGKRYHQPPEMGEMTTADEFANPTKKTLANGGYLPILGIGLLLHGLVPARSGKAPFQAHNMKESPFSLGFQAC
jgi:hypothetical protein